VSTQWLDENIIQPDVVAVDLRERALYDQQHIPGAYWLDQKQLDDRSNPPSFLIGAPALTALMKSIGVSDSSHVVAIDQNGGRDAARLWWVLAYFGHERTSLLDGGFEKWEGEGRAMTFEPPFDRPANFTPKPRTALLATASQVKDAISKKTVLIDARSPVEYTGEHSRSRRAGHIPGARNLTWSEDLAPRDGVMVFRSQEDLVDRYRKAGVTKDAPVIVYCLEGRRSPHVLFTLALTGLQPAAVLYAGGWQEWANSDAPVETTKPPATRGPSPPKPAPKGS
jgi:thiosulfate/3-mercaptopyruvate sulfurtransferase